LKRTLIPLVPCGQIRETDDTPDWLKLMTIEFFAATPEPQQVVLIDVFM